MFHKMSVDEVLKELDSNLDGLTEEEVNKRKEKYGYNIVENETKVSKLTLLLKQFKDSMIIMLLIVAIISFVYSNVVKEPYTDTIIIIIIILINVLMGYFQESKAEASIDSLKKINKTMVKVKRNNEVFLTDSIHLVPGDIIMLEAGDKIPADARVISESSAKVDESILTGESVPVEKTSIVISADTLINDRINMLYSGCSVINGTIQAVVTATSMNTEIGKIATSIVEDKDVPTPLQQKINEISKNLSVIVIILIGLVFTYNLFFLKSDILNLIMLTMSLLISAVPEGLPAVISISLSVGVKELAKKNTLVRTLSSVETLGAVQIVCSDKTGTITQNKMTVVNTYNNCKEVIAKEDIDKNMIYNMYLCNTVDLRAEKLIGDPTEIAIIEYVKNCKKINLKSIEKIVDVPFDSERKLMSSIQKVDNNLVMYTKGSLESILNRSKFYSENNEIVKLTEQKKKEILKVENEYAKKALRVIAFAYKTDVDYNKNTKDDELLDLEKDLIFSGMVGMIDPEREGVKEAIKECKQASITPIMITGDSITTALAIANNIGLIDDDSQGIEGKELAKYTDEEMKSLVKKYRVYARVSPSDKVRIVNAWQKNNKIVAMTGDGVNDAPSIKLADIGIGMGNSGTEVTKSASDVLLLDDCFNTIVSAIKEGRRIYDNIRNIILYSLSSNFAELFIILFGIFMGINLLLPIQILYIDLVTDAILAICLAFEAASDDIMLRKPHKSSNKFFTPYTTIYLVLSSIFETLLIFMVYKIGVNKYGMDIAQSMSFLCLIIQELVFAYNCRNLHKTIIKHGIFKNQVMNVGALLIILIQLFVFVTPLRSVLHLTLLSVDQLLIIVVLNIIVFIIMEVLKPILSNKFSD